jgi:hypothetical protein
MVAALYIVYNAHKLKSVYWMWVFIALAILFNPIAPFYLSKSTWHDIDFIAAIIFFVGFFGIKEGDKKI